MNKLLICGSLLVALFAAGCGSTRAENPDVLDVTPSRGNLDIGTSHPFSVSSPNNPAFTGVTWSLVGAGQLSNSSAYQVTYTAPANPGTAQLIVTSNNDPSVTATIPISVTPDPVIANSKLPTAILGKAYNAPVTANGGVLPLSWSIVSGALPSGLTLNSGAGAITGIPSSTGSSTFSLTVTDSGTPPFSSSQSTTIVVAAPLTINPISFAAASLGALYSVVPTATGGVAPYTWSISSGALPAGMTLNSATGAISGTPTLAGNSAFTLQAADSSLPPQTATASASINVLQPLSITTSSLPDGTSGSAYSASIAAAGGVAPLTWTVTSGSLPNGLTLNSATGAISGTPSSAGLATFSVRVSDSSSPAQSVTLPLAIQINPAFSITNLTLPNAIKSVPYVGALVATGASGAVTWSVTTGTLPTGLSLNAGTGVISGTPTAAGSFSFTIQGKDSANPPRTATQALTIVVNQPLTIGASLLVNGVIGVPYSATASISGGTAPFTWSVTAGALPAGLSLNATTGTITGTPTTVALSSFTLQVTDSSVPAQTATLPTSISINAALAITLPSFPDAISGIPYATTLTATGGTLPDTWAITAGSLPAGLTLNGTTGVVSGTASVVGTYNFTVKVTDSSQPAQTKTFSTSIRVDSLLTIAPVSLPGAILGLVFNGTISASGGVGPLNFSVSAGALPAGLTLNAATGVISGTPTTVANTNFTIQVQDSATPPQVKTVNVALQVAAPLSITSTTLPSAITSILYDTTLTTSGGTGPVTWAITAGTLPSGLTLTATTGVIAGTPLLAGSGSFTIQATDSSTPPQVKTASLSLQVNPLLAITTSTLPNAVSSLLYGTTLSATGGAGAITWSVTAGALPTGLTLNATTGAISGIPTVLGPASFTVQAKDSANPAQTKSVSLSILVNPVLTITSTTLPNAILSVLYGTNLSSSGGSGAVTWSITAGALPTGLTLNATTGAISGIPLSVGTSNFSITATDSSTPPQVKTLSVGIQTNSQLGISLSSLPDAVLGNLYSTTLSATGGVAPITWSVTAGSLPLGLSLNTSGLVSGTPTALGNVSFTIQAKDSSNPPQTKTAVVSIQTNPLLSIVSSTLPDAVVGILYNSTLTTSGGVAPIKWAVTAGTLPTGIALNATTGVLSGTPSVGATGSIIFQATDSSNPPQVQTVSLGLNVFAKLGINPVTLPPGLLSTLFDESLTATGGDGTYTWSVTTGSLPSGISLNAATGALTGTPLSLGSFSFTIQAQDTANPPQVATIALNLSVASPGVNNALLAGDYAFMFEGSNASGPVALAGSFVADGAGSITSGVMDISQTSGVTQNIALTSGNFVLNSDNRGTLTITTAQLGTQNFRMAVNAAGTLARFIEFDEASPETIRGNGVIKKQNPAAFSDSGISSDLAFGFEGATSTGGRSALIGSIVTNGAGKITSGLVDSNSNSTVNANKAVSNTSTYSISGSTGRGTISLNIASVGTVNGVLYVVSATDAFFMRTDALAAGKDLLSGELLGQSGGPFGILPLGTSVLHLQGNSTATTTSVGAGLVVSTGLGALTGTFDATDNGTVTSTLLATGSSTISSAAAGRGALTFAGHTLTLYYVNPSEAFVMDSSGAEVKTGMLEGQSGFPLTLLNLTSQLVQGSEGVANSNVTYQSGVDTISSVTSLLGSVAGTFDTNGSGDSLAAGNLLSAAVSLSTNGRITSGATVYYVVSSSRIVAVEVGAGQTEARVLVEDK